MQKWDFKTRKYEPYNIPEAWSCKTFSMDMDEIVNCPHCGREVTFGECYTSRQIHTEHGMGYAVCEECYEAEWEAEKESKTWV